MFNLREGSKENLQREGKPDSLFPVTLHGPETSEQGYCQSETREQFFHWSDTWLTCLKRKSSQYTPNRYKRKKLRKVGKNPGFPGMVGKSENFCFVLIFFFKSFGRARLFSEHNFCSLLLLITKSWR